MQDVNHPSIIKAMGEVHRALELDPNNELALELAQQLVWNAPDGAVTEKDDGTFDFLYLTATPPLPSEPEPAPVLPTETIAPTWTPEPAPGDEETVPTAVSNEEDKGTGLPICGGAALILPVVSLYLGRRRREK
jgi:hypothetical protein